jgi:hypothetical protein
MADLCYITTCKGRLAHLKQTLPRVAGQPGLSCVVVDYSCPQGTAGWVEANFPQVRVVRVEGESGFNLSRARNLGAQAADAPWLGFFDADILLDPGFASVVAPQLVPGRFFRPHPVTIQTWGSIICHRDDFAAVGGYDEAYVGWGGEDDDLIAVLALAGRQAAGFPAALLSEIPHSDQERTLYFDIKDRRVQSRINQIYLQIKLDLARLMGRSPLLEERRAVYGEVQRVITQVENGNRLAPAVIEVNMPAALIGTPPQSGPAELSQLSRKLVYSLNIEGTYRNPETPMAANPRA